MYVFGKLVRTDFEAFIGRQINDRGCGVIVGGVRGGRDLLSELIIEALIEFNINSSRGGILSFSHRTCAW